MRRLSCIDSHQLGLLSRSSYRKRQTETNERYDVFHNGEFHDFPFHSSDSQLMRFALSGRSCKQSSSRLLLHYLEVRSLPSDDSLAKRHDSESRTTSSRTSSRVRSRARCRHIAFAWDGPLRFSTILNQNVSRQSSFTSPANTRLTSLLLLGTDHRLQFPLEQNYRLNRNID